MNHTAAGFAGLLFLAGTPLAATAQNANAPVTTANQATVPATDATLGAEGQGEDDLQINAIVRQLEQRSRVLDARQATLEEQERLLTERARVQNERELQLREREQQVIEREQVLATQVPLATPEANVGVAAPGIESPPGTPTPRTDFQEPDFFNPGLDNETFQPGLPNNFSAGPQDTRNNFISP